jgi:hypothetical protein
MPFLAICYRCNHRFYVIRKETLILELKQHFLKSHKFLPELPPTKTNDYDIMVITWKEYNEKQLICNSGNKLLRAAFWQTANTKI